ncbi:hypothetical protein ANCDUO_09593 [Ancylostoma duodenale]|uniref:7TM GPCR serpentine receptor class x (Srx) domain-containing protein n=1 Tax=Ancylostoma duodenale TaxID=51022 RepID=A0A0C2GG91_9BILA|nr:hypothetical protein ANCDUO_09593 [Ancylostoma duodenale]
MNLSITSSGEEFHITAGVIMILVSGIGCVVNLAVIALIFKTPSLNNAFGHIWSSHLLGGFGVLLINVLWAAPVTIL